MTLFTINAGMFTVLIFTCLLLLSTAVVSSWEHGHSYKMLLLNSSPWALAIIILLSDSPDDSWILMGGWIICPIWGCTLLGHLFSVLWVMWVSVLTTVHYSKCPLWQMVKFGILSNIQRRSHFSAWHWFLYVILEPCDPMYSEFQMFWTITHAYILYLFLERLLHVKGVR